MFPVMSADNPNEVWRTPPELDQPLPRPVRLTGTAAFRCVIAAACIAFGVNIASRAIHDELRREAENTALARSLATDGHETEATVTRLSTTLGHLVGYSYTVDGHNYSRGAFITAEHWQSLQVGSPLAIRYLPSDPQKSYPESDSPDSQTHWLAVLPIAGMALFFMFSFAYLQLSPVLRGRRLLARGRPAQGVVTQCKAGSQGRSNGYFLNYEFQLPDGSSCKGKKFSSSQLAEKSSVTVLYLPERPQRNTLYPMETVRLAAAP
jgi:hypothetical protein